MNSIPGVAERRRAPASERRASAGRGGFQGRQPFLTADVELIDRDETSLPSPTLVSEVPPEATGEGGFARNMSAHSTRRLTLSTETSKRSACSRGSARHQPDGRDVDRDDVDAGSETSCCEAGAASAAPAAWSPAMAASYRICRLGKLAAPRLASHRHLGPILRAAQLIAFTTRSIGREPLSIAALCGQCVVEARPGRIRLTWPSAEAARGGADLPG